MSFTKSSLAIVAVTASLALGCSGEPPKPPPAPTAAPTPAPTPEAKPTAEPTAEPVVEEPKRQSSGRPASIYGPSSKISSTFGSTPGAVLRLKVGKDELVELKIQEFSLRGGTNITFEPDKVKSAHAVVGSIVKLTPTEPEKVKPKKFPADEAPFIFRFPMSGKDTVNLAIGEFDMDAGGKIKVTGWTVVKPTRVEGTDAIFELDYLPPAYLHTTTDEPAAPAEDKPAAKPPAG